MISARTLQSLEAAFTQALHQTLVLSAADSLQIRPGKPGSTAPADARKLLALTLSAGSFRIITLFEFRLDAATRAHFAGPSSPAQDGNADQRLADALAEFVNLVCGTANRLISSDCRRTGMSTPCALESSCLSHLHRLQPEQTLVLNASIGEALQFDIVLGICLSKGTSLDFDIAPAAQEEMVGGELELF